jgi:stage II sporulation protein M
MVVEHIRQRWFSYGLAGLMLIMGITSGAIAIRTLSLPQKQDLISYINQYFDSVLLGNMEPASWQAVLWTNSQALIVQMMCGLIVFGVPLVLGYLFLRGFILGFSVGFFVDEMGLRGLLFACASIVPHHLFVIPAVIGIGALALSFAFDSISLSKRGKSLRRGRSALATYLVNALPFALLLVISGLIEVYITPVFIKAVVALF